MHFVIAPPIFFALHRMEPSADSFSPRFSKLRFSTTETPASPAAQRREFPL